MSISCDPACQDRGLELGFHGLEFDVEAVDVGEFLGGHPAAGLAGLIPRPHAGQQRLVLAGGLLHRRPAGD
jgi:hypothetical protein